MHEHLVKFPPEGQRYHEGPDAKDRASEIVIGIMVGVGFGLLLLLLSVAAVLL